MPGTCVPASDTPTPPSPPVVAPAKGVPSSHRWSSGLESTGCCCVWTLVKPRGKWGGGEQRRGCWGGGKGPALIWASCLNSRAGHRPGLLLELQRLHVTHTVRKLHVGDFVWVAQETRPRDPGEGYGHKGGYQRLGLVGGDASQSDLSWPPGSKTWGARPGPCRGAQAAGRPV